MASKAKNDYPVKDVLEFNEECKALMKSDDVKDPLLRFEIYQSLVETSSIKESFQQAAQPILKKFGTKNEQGGYTIPKENWNNYVDALAPLESETTKLKELLTKDLVMKLESSIPNTIYGFLK
jgi:hypothetical protein